MCMTSKELMTTTDLRLGDDIPEYREDFDEGVDISKADDTETEDIEETVEPRPRRKKPEQFPTGKPGRYSKDRRYVPATKKSDQGKVLSGSGKGAKHKKRIQALNQSVLQD